MFLTFLARPREGAATSDAHLSFGLPGRAHCPRIFHGLARARVDRKSSGLNGRVGGWKDPTDLVFRGVAGRGAMAHCPLGKRGLGTAFSGPALRGDRVTPFLMVVFRGAPSADFPLFSFLASDGGEEDIQTLFWHASRKRWSPGSHLCLEKEDWAAGGGLCSTGLPLALRTGSHQAGGGRRQGYPSRAAAKDRVTHACQARVTPLRTGLPPPWPGLPLPGQGCWPLGLASGSRAAFSASGLDLHPPARPT